MDDLESYIGRYTGETRLRRLLSIAAHQQQQQQQQHHGSISDEGNDNDNDNVNNNVNVNANTNLSQRQRALNLAERQMRRDGNALLYRQVFGGNGEGGRNVDPKLFEGLPPLDVNWMNATENSNRETRHVLEGRLSTAQSRLHKDAIRTAYLALAEHDVRTGRDNHKSLFPMLIMSSSGISNNNPIAAAIPDNVNTTNTTTTTTTNKNVHVNANVNAALFRAIDFCTTRVQTAQIGLLIMESALNAGDYGTVRDYAERTESTLKSLKSNTHNNNNNNNNNYTNNSSSSSSNNNFKGDPANQAVLCDIGVKVQITKGIERMIAGDYRGAANVLVPLVMKGSGDDNNNDDENNNSKQQTTTTKTELHMLHWPGVTSPEDVALYAGLMCLVTRDRAKMLALADHPEALELVPAVKELLLYWSRANYAPCMRAISSISISSTSSLATAETATETPALSQPLLPLGLVDVYLTPTRWNALVQTIRETCLVEYLRPYQRVKLESLRDLFFPSSSVNNLDSVIDTLVDLMDRRLLPSTTRLDCRENILFQAEPSQDPAPNIQAMEESVLDNAHAMLVRLACLEHDLVVCGDHPNNSSSGRGSSIGGGVAGRRGKGNKNGGMRSSRYRQQQHQQQQSGQQRLGFAPINEANNASGGSGSGAMLDSSGSDDDDDDDDDSNDGNYEVYEEQVPRDAGDIDIHDTHMIDAETETSQSQSNSNSNNNAAMNPEDMY